MPSQWLTAAHCTSRAGVPGLNEKENKAKKQVPLRLSASLYAELAAWAENDFRSVNGQIEYLLTECVKWRKRGGKQESDNK